MMRLLRWYLDCWRQAFGFVGAAIGLLVLLAVLGAVAVLLLPWLWSLALLSGPAVLLLAVFAPFLITALFASWLGRVVDPLRGGAPRKTKKAASQWGGDAEHVYRSLRKNIRGQNGEVVADIVASTGLGLVIATVAFGLIYWIFAFLTMGLQSMGISAPSWLAMAFTGMSMLICAIAAIYGYEPQRNLGTGHSLDRPYVPSQRHLDQGVAFESLVATLLVEPFRLIATGISLCGELRLEDAKTLQSAAHVLTSHSPEADTEVSVLPEVAGVLLRCRLLKEAPQRGGDPTFVLTEKYKELFGLPSVGSDGLRFRLLSVNDCPDRVSSRHERHSRREIPDWKRC